jgi:GTP cyclohydrolase I
MVDIEKASKAMKMFLEAIGEDPNREGLKETPMRVAKMYNELTFGYDDDPSVHLQKVFSAENSELVIVKDIEFFSLCEHHLLPFFGKVHIAYLPDNKVVGLSKLARCTESFARRLQIQERMNTQIADSINDSLSPLGVMVVIEAEHTCMSMRGIKSVGAKTVTFATRGLFKTDSNLRREVLDLINVK